MVWLSGDFSSIQMKRSGCPTWSLMSSNAMAWTLDSVNRRQLMMNSGSDGCSLVILECVHADDTRIQYWRAFVRNCGRRHLCACIWDIARLEDTLAAHNNVPSNNKT